MTSARVDVLIVEDQPDEVDRIAKWFGLAPYQFAACTRFTAATPTGRHPQEESDRGWKWIESEIRRVDPRVVVFDYLLSKELGNASFDGLLYGRRCKLSQNWPELGVVVVTTGGDGELEGQVQTQEELDDQFKKNEWPINAAWIKPWGTAKATLHDTKVQAEIQKLIRQSRRPSERKQTP